MDIIEYERARGVEISHMPADFIDATREYERKLATGETTVDGRAHVHATGDDDPTSEPWIDRLYDAHPLYAELHPPEPHGLGHL